MGLSIARRALVMGMLGGGAAATYQSKVRSIFGANLVAHLPMKELSGTAFSDVSGNGLNASITGIALDAVDAATGGRGGRWDGLNDFATITQAAAWQAAEFTLGMWIKPFAALSTGTYVFFDGYNLTLSQGYRLLYVNDTLYYSVFTTTGSATVTKASSSSAFGTNWHHLGMTWKRPTLTAYFDGQLVNTAVRNEDVVFTADAIYIGTLDTIQYFFDGYSTDLVYANREATGAEMAQVGTA